MASNYTIEKELGRGEFGITYLGKDDQTGKNVAIKVIDVNNSTEKGSDKNIILQELKTMEVLSGTKPKGPGCQPNIACFYDSFEEMVEGRPSVVAVSEYVSGGDLKEYVDKRIELGMPPNPNELWQMMIDMITALDYIHAKGFAHRDIKTDNIMMDANGRLKIIDFGLACTTACRPGAGTLPYMSPEIFNKSAPSTLKASQAHDIFSMGIVFYELANLGMPFDMITEQDVKTSMALDPFTKTNSNNSRINGPTVNQPWRNSRYSQADPNSKISNETFNSIIRMMLDRNWTTRPTARQLVQYIGEEENGCIIDGITYNRGQIYSQLDKSGIRFDIDPGYIYLSQLCEYISGKKENGYYSMADIAPTYLNQSYVPLKQYYGTENNQISNHSSNNISKNITPNRVSLTGLY